MRGKKGNMKGKKKNWVQKNGGETGNKDRGKKELKRKERDERKWKKMMGGNSTIEVFF